VMRRNRKFGPGVLFVHPKVLNPGA
jgi:hypothetical protein